MRTVTCEGGPSAHLPRHNISSPLISLGERERESVRERPGWGGLEVCFSTERRLTVGRHTIPRPGGGSREEMKEQQSGMNRMG
jgi:hypothetical protein